MSKYLITGLLLLTLGLLAGCRRSASEKAAPFQTGPLETLASDAAPTADDIRQDAQLIASAQTEEEAQSIAALYGIRLVNWSYGVAAFYTEEDPREVIRRGQENGWPELSLNHIQKAFDTQ